MGKRKYLVIPSEVEGSRSEISKVTSSGSLDPAAAGLGMTGKKASL
jgi:hypothetical protein